ncbi:hypothetical protein [Nonomuraea sp. NPDC005650]|uniref:hypothetical protein n=1 Tax=Nonomuraea sp. NPDC005650 TaxID=3157045 RepID=UPI0033BE2110
MEHDNEADPTGSEENETPAQSGWDIPGLVLFLNATTAGLGGLYIATHSVLVTLVAAALVAALAGCMALRGRRTSG